MVFSVKIGSLELRSCNDNLLLDGVHTKAEVLQKEGDHCYTIAFWDQDNEGGFELRFVGDRPLQLDTHMSAVCWKLFDVGQLLVSMEVRP